MHLVAAQIEEPVTQTYFLAVIPIAVNLQRQLLCGSEYFAGIDPQFDFARGKVRIFRIATAFLDPTCDANDRFQPQGFDLWKDVRIDLDYALRQPEMIAQIDEQQIAVIAFVVIQPDRRASIRRSRRGVPRSYGCGKRA